MKAVNQAGHRGEVISRRKAILLMVGEVDSKLGENEYQCQNPCFQAPSAARVRRLEVKPLDKTTGADSGFLGIF